MIVIENVIVSGNDILKGKTTVRGSGKMILSGKTSEVDIESEQRNYFGKD